MEEKDSSLRSRRSNRLDIIAERKRKAAADWTDSKSSYVESGKLKEELRAGRRCARLMSESSIIFDEIVDFSIFPLELPFNVKFLREDFDIPKRWKTDGKSQLNTFPRYRALTKNLYRSPLQRGSCSADDIPYCSCHPDKNCGLDCENRLLFMECAAGDCPSLPAKMDFGSEDFCRPCKNSRNNNLRGRSSNGSGSSSTILFCANTSIQRISYPLSEVFKTGSCGYGLRISEDIEIGKVVVEYTGEVITAAECSERMKDMKERDDFYFASLGGGLMLDAKYMGSVARFANHSCEPTCKLQKWSVLGESCIVLVAAKFLSAGSEITYNYQYYEDGLDKISVKMKRQKCLCGAVNCSGTIGGKVTVSESDSWLKKASLLISSDRKNSLDILNHHIQLSETINMSPNCPELVELKKIVKEINQWVVKKNEIFSNYSKTCTLMDFSVAQQLSESYHWAFRANDFILLEQQMKKVLKIEKALRSLRDDSPTQRGASLRSVTDSDESRDDPLGAFNDSGLKDTDGSTNSCSKVSARSESSEREKISHSEDDINSSYTLNTGDDSTIRSSTIVHTGDISNNCDEGDRCDRPEVLPSLILPVSLSSASASSCIQGPPHQTIIFQKKILVKTKLSVHNESTTEEDDDIRGRGDGCGKQEKSVDVSFISSNAVLVFENGRDYMGVNTSPCEESDADFKTNRGGSSSMAGNESNGNIKVTSSGKIDTDSRNPSSLTDHSDMKLDQNCKLAKVHWNNLMSLFKDVVSVLPLRCIGVEILLSLYHSVNVWTKRYIGGILHHCSFASLYSRVPSLIDPIPPILPSVPLLLNSEEESLPGLLHPRTSNSTDACPLSSSISSKTSTSVQNASVSKSVSMKNVQQKVPGHSLINAIDCVASQYSERTPACEVFAAETFLEFRVGLFMERMAAISSTNTVNEVNSSAVMASSSVPSTSASSVPSLPSSGSVDPTDILCFCRMPAAMGETPVLSQCDSCDRWYHPNCVNAALVSQSASRSSDSFLCPLCLHMQGRHSNFAYKPFSEWKIIRNAGSGSLKKKPIVTTAAAAAASKITTATSAAGSSKEDKKGAKAIVHAASSNGLIGKRLSDKELLAESKRVRTKVTASSKSAIRTNTDSDLDSVRKVGTNAPVLCTSFDRGKSSTDCSGDISAIQCGERVYDFPLPHDSLETVFSRRHEQYDPNGSNEYQQEVSATLQINSIEENLNSICLLSDSITENDITFSLVRSETLSDIKLESLNIEGTFDLPDGRISSDVSLGLLTSSPNLEDSLSLPRDKNPATAATDSLSAPSLSKTSLVAKTKALSSTGRKGIKVTSPRPASDPLSSEDLRDAIKAERVLTVSQSPAALLLGLCSIYIEAWRERAIAFLSRSDVLSVILRNYERDLSDQTQKDNQFNIGATESQADIFNNDTPVEGGLDREADMKRRKSETMLLKECLHLYIEPRLLRIQPPESLELRAVAYFISASTVLTTGNSYAPKKHHSVSKNGKSSPNPALKTDLIDGVGKEILGIPQSYCHPDRKKVPSTNNTSNNFQGHPTLRELEMIIDGGKYFLRLQLSGKTDSKGLKGQTQTSCTSKAWVSQPLDEPKGSLKEVGCGNIYNSISESIAAAGDRENVEEIDASREKERERERVKRRLVLWAGIQRVTDILSIRLHQCQHALRISSHCTLNGTISSLDSTRSVTNALRSNFGSSNSINGGFSTRLNLLAISTGNSVAVEVNSVTFMDVHTKNSSLNPCNVKSSLDELLRVDALLEEAGRGLSIQGEYAYVRLQSLIFAGMKNLGSGSEHQECQVMRGVSLEEMEGKGEVGLRKDPTEVSHDVILPPVIAGELYCWCRGNDDGFPMVQCDGCDEWFHSRCMGITKQSQAKPQKQEADKQLKGKCVRGSSYLPTMNIQATDVEEHSDSICTLGAERPFMKSVGKCKAAAITKSKGKGKGIKLMKHLEESVEDTFYCISCAERRGTSYAFEWHSDSSTARQYSLHGC